jgi:hypothetical protein
MQLRRPRLGSFSMVQDRVVDTPIVREPALTVIARLGFAARGLLYLLVGGFAVAAALGLGQQPHGIMDVLTALMDTRLQTVLAAVIGLGLACLAGYFAIRGLSHCCRGSGARRWLFGAGMIADALIYGVVMISLLSLALGWHPDGERETQVWTAWALSQPFGRAVVGFIGLVILGCGIGVVVWVMTTDVDDDVDLPEDEKRLIEPVARYGLAGRGVGAALVGIYWMSAGLHGEPSRAHELGGALQTVQQNSRGWLLLLPLGIAFAASALFDFIEALYHRPHRP